MTTGEADSAAAYLPEGRSLSELRAAASGCRGCDLYRDATQTVFGDGAADAAVMFVGEQPGDQEDREGEPFVGPAGRELDRALEAVGIDRDQVFITNAVKHFKWKRKGRKRLHQTPSREQIEACRPWLDAEIEAVRPDVIVALGATAAKALLGPGFRVTRQRGELHRGPGDVVVTATVHPSSILRAPSDQDRHDAREAFTADLAKIADVIRGGAAHGLLHDSRQELYDRARALDVPGRSSMSKTELAEAVADQLDRRQE
ncbi:MAG TPA: UdgX family uracil-DNA binding protein [Nitriliruptorales bacterium]|nr:UdgX family uracil-DNA binding protein [Nitriliruptorales bacterium]